MAVREKGQFIQNGIYFITFTILDWKNIFISDKYCQLVYKWFDYMRCNYANKIYGYVIMPSHIHVLLLISEKSTEISTLIYNAKRFLAYGIVKYLEEDGMKELLDHFKNNVYGKSKAKHKIFKERFDSIHINSEKFFREKLNYIHKNPCQEKSSLVEKPEDYVYSSASNYILGKGKYEVDLMNF